VRRRLFFTALKQRERDAETQRQRRQRKVTEREGKKEMEIGKDSMVRNIFLVFVIIFQY
jgi:hypothetical protein